MSTIHETTQTAFIYTACAVCFCFFLFNIRTCQQSMDSEREKTNQEAIKAGLVQGEFGRWVKPPGVEK